jgi:hypothetical protein
MIKKRGKQSVLPGCATPLRKALEVRAIRMNFTTHQAVGRLIQPASRNTMKATGEGLRIMHKF